VGIRRSAANLVERIIGARIVPPKQIPLLFEERHLRLFFHCFRIDCVFDVGANLGQYATMIRQRARFTGPIISYEPNPEIAPMLRDKAQCDKDWYVEEVALSCESGNRNFNVMANDQMSSLNQPQDKETDLFVEATEIVRRVPVQVSTLSDELEKYRKLIHFERPFLKIDTQGHDLQVARGAGDKLSDFVGIQTELAVRRIYAETPRYDEAINFYTDRGFVISAFVPNNEGNFPYLIETDCIMFRGSGSPDK
jgi:FkbM family methyltransferase